MSTQYTKLKSRGLIKISGEDRISFLQNLVTNDVEKTSRQDLVYTCLLSPQGKFLFDFFMRSGNDCIMLDCEGGERLEQLFKRLSLYKLRSKVTLEKEDNIDVYACWGDKAAGLKDPRHPELGYRFYTEPTGEEAPFEEWDTHRIKLCIPDGSRDLITEKSTLLENHIDKLNGIDFQKGCYVGQEVTARMHYRGLVKKHLYIIENNTLPDTGAAISFEDKTVGEMRSSCGQVGLALIKDDYAEKLKGSMPL